MLQQATFFICWNCLSFYCLSQIFRWLVKQDFSCLTKVSTWTTGNDSNQRKNKTIRIIPQLKHHSMIRENSNDMIWSCSHKGRKKKLENQFKSKNTDHLAMFDDVFIGKLSFGDRIPEGWYSIYEYSFENGHTIRQAFSILPDNGFVAKVLDIKPRSSLLCKKWTPQRRNFSNKV